MKKTNPMTQEKRVFTRRDFIRAGSCVVTGSLMGLLLLKDNAEVKTEDKSRVVLIRDKEVFNNSGFLRSSTLAQMLDQALIHLLETNDAASGWRKLFKPSDIVGIKSNVWGPLPTPSSLEDALIKRLAETGIGVQNISVDDRGVRHNPVFKRANALINIRPIRSHHWAGLGTLIKNYIMFSGMPWAYHGNACARLGAVWQKYELLQKTRLNILVMLTPLFHGIGPHHFSRRYTWPYCGLIVSTDAVSADAIGARIIQAKRNDYFGKDSPISPRPLHIETADVRFGLGNSHPDRITLVKAGWEKDSFI